MELSDFLAQVQSDVRARIDDRQGDLPYPYPESIFTEVVMDHMAEIGMIFEPQPCHYATKVNNANLKLSGFAFSEDADQVDLFVSLYAGTDSVQAIPDEETKKAAEHCLRFLVRCAEGRLKGEIDPSNAEAHMLAALIEENYPRLEQVRIYVLTDRTARTTAFQSRDVGGKSVKLEVMDIGRLFRHWSEGKPRDEIVVNFQDLCGSAIPCVYIPGDKSDYDCALAALPGEALRFVYEKYGARLLEANVRSFLISAAGKPSAVNTGIRDTLRGDPAHFMAFNNGIVVVADEVVLGRTPDGGPGIVALKGMQIVNGGQTTASLYFTKKKHPDVVLDHVRVPAKIISLRSPDASAEEALVGSISRFANSQNAVKLSDLSANKPFHVELERLAQTTVCPDGVGRWFYERATGSYTTLLAREGGTPAKLKHLKTVVCPPERKITKTDMAKYLNAWAQRPDSVSFGDQKNFGKFMETLKPADGESAVPLPDLDFFKGLVAKALLFKAALGEVPSKPSVPRANIATYLVALVANRLGERLDLGRIWAEQKLSAPLRQLLLNWASEVETVIRESNPIPLASEWAKKPGCWEAVRTATYSNPPANIPELRAL